MEANKMMQMLEDTAYYRVSGTEGELKAAEYLKEKCEELGFEARIEAFDVAMTDIKKAVLIADGQEIPCKGFRLAGNADIEAPLYYMPTDDPVSLMGCKDKIVLLDTGVPYWKYQDLLKNGAVGFITYDGNANFEDSNMDLKELRPHVSDGVKIPGVNINAKSAIELVRNNVQNVRIILEQEEYTGQSHNVVMDIPGETDEVIVLTAHYDTVPTSIGVYDNMSGSIGIFAVADYFAKNPHRYGLRFVWCGSEERGLLGSKAYCAAHKDELEKVVLNVNLDMIGSIMGNFIAVCSCEDKMVHFIEYLSGIEGFGLKARQDVYASDSTPFADNGVPSLSFARIAPNHTVSIHNRYDTIDVMKAENMAKDVDFITTFVDIMANAKKCPVSRVIPDKVKDKLDIYMARKRG
ncbi:MAG: M28 family peptidase [Lachnospiraceae bacterium]|nr:M28 family peptidase [Lachnospiraceae bacterium]